MKTIITFITLMITGMGTAQACPFQSFLDLEKQGPAHSNPSTQVSDRVKWEDSLKVEFAKNTKTFFDLYIQETQLAALKCDAITPRLQDKIDNNFGSLFLKTAAKKLTQSKNESVKAYAKKILATLDSGFIMPTKIFLHLGDHHPSEKPAGYDRSNKGIFFDLLEINPVAFNIYLIHEFAHAFDPKLAEAINTFNSSELTAVVAAMVRSKKQLKDLSLEERKQVDQYVLAGMNRGVLAELRAWTTTSQLYLEMVKAGEQTPLAFMDQILGNNRLLAATELQQIWQTYLFQNFEKPTTGLFASPLLQDGVNQQLNTLKK